MNKWSLCAAVFLWFCPISLSQPTAREQACAAGVELVYLTYGLRGEANVKPRYKLEEHVANAMRAVLEGWASIEGNEVPLLFAEPKELRNAEDLWWSLMRNYVPHQYYESSAEDPFVLTPWPGGDANTFRFETKGATEGSKRVFRFQARAPQGNIRAQSNADRLSATMGLRNSLVTRLAMVNGQQGVVSEWVEGRTLENVTTADIDRMIAANEIDEASFADASAFEWLVNHSRCEPSRFIVTAEGKIVVVTRAGGCLNCSTNPPPDDNQFYLGWTLPKRYSRDFVEKLKRLDRETLAFSVQLDLGTAESTALLFRREVILKDVELRGEAGLIP